MTTTFQENDGPKPLILQAEVVRSNYVQAEIEGSRCTLLSPLKSMGNSQVSLPLHLVTTLMQLPLAAMAGGG